MEYFLLNDYLSALAAKGLVISFDGEAELLSREIKNVSYDTREEQEDSLFLCKGAHFRPEYIQTAKEKGAVCILTEKQYENCPLPQILVRDIRKSMVQVALLYFGDAPSKLISVGITGTKGKSTITYQLRSILNCMQKREIAVLSSIDNYDGVIREESHLTTPEVLDLHRHFANAVKSGISHLVMEVSSQALKVGRVDGVRYEVGAFHNIGTDHISPIEHPDFEDYYRSKLKIFEHCRIGCVNTDAERAEETLAYAKAHCEKVLTYGEKPENDIYCHDIRKMDEGIEFSVRTPSYEDRFLITMPGMFNVSNAVCAVCICEALGVPKECIREGLRTARAAGRMEVYSSKDNRITVIVDYAHNRMSFEALFESVGVEFPGKEKIAVFGCPGKKAFLRRKDLGEIAGRDCDCVIITEEDSGEEPFESIAADIEKSVREYNDNVLVCEDRGEAIRHAILDSPEAKVVLLTGKGRETRMKRGLAYIDTPSDVDYTEKYLKEYDEKSVLVK